MAINTPAKPMLNATSRLRPKPTRPNAIELSNNTSADGRLGGAVFCPPGQQIYCTTFEVVANCMAGIAGERISRGQP